MKTAAAIVASALLSVSMALPAHATLVADQGEYTQHVIDCLGLLLSDPARHAAECGGPFEFVPPSDLQENPPPPPPKDECDKSWAFAPVGTTWKVAARDCCETLQSANSGGLQDGLPFLLTPGATIIVAYEGCSIPPFDGE